MAGLCFRKWLLKFWQEVVCCAAALALRLEFSAMTELLHLLHVPLVNIYNTDESNFRLFSPLSAERGAIVTRLTPRSSSSESCLLKEERYHRIPLSVKKQKICVL